MNKREFYLLSFIAVNGNCYNVVIGKDGMVELLQRHVHFDGSILFDFQLIEEA